MLIRLAGGFILCSLLTGCALFIDNRSVSRPPGDKVAAQKWWEETVEQVDIATLRCWYNASEFHRQHGSSATYLDHSYCGHNMIGPCYYDRYFPTPIPQDVLPRVQARLSTETPKDDAREVLVSVEECRHCTRQEAVEAWRK